MKCSFMEVTSIVVPILVVRIFLVIILVVIGHMSIMMVLGSVVLMVVLTSMRLVVGWRIYFCQIHVVGFQLIQGSDSGPGIVRAKELVK